MKEIPVAPLTNPSHEALNAVQAAEWRKTYLSYDDDLVVKKQHGDVLYLAMWVDMEWRNQKIYLDRWVYFLFTEEMFQRVDKKTTPLLALLKQSASLIVTDCVYGNPDEVTAERMSFEEYAAKYPDYQIEDLVYL